MPRTIRDGGIARSGDCSSTTAGRSTGTAVQRLWRREGIRVPPTKSKTSGKRAGRSAENSIWNFPAVFVDHVWTIDFVTDYTVHGTPFRSFNVLDEFTRYFVGAHVARSIGARQVREFFAVVFEREGKPKFLRADNGREFIGVELADWLTEHGVTILFVEKASPQQNGFVESFHSRIRDECLNAEEFDSVLEARVVIGQWRDIYNHTRRHRGLGLRTRRRSEPRLSPPELRARGAMMVVARRGVDESDYHHCSWTSPSPLPRGAITTPNVQPLSQELARPQGAVHPRSQRPRPGHRGLGATPRRSRRRLHRVIDVGPKDLR